MHLVGSFSGQTVADKVGLEAPMIDGNLDCEMTLLVGLLQSNPLLYSRSPSSVVAGRSLDRRIKIDPPDCVRRCLMPHMYRITCQTVCKPPDAQKIKTHFKNIR